jgi:two-component system, NtrC family, nitrogen regulation response regulator GlnG
MTAFGDLSSAVQAIELDIFEYLPKPFDLSDGLKAVSKAISSKIPTDYRDLHPHESIDSLVGQSADMQTVYKQIAIASKSHVPVLIHGPNGVGKESVASAIHRHSLRHRSPFLVFAPAAIPPVAVQMDLLGGYTSASVYRSGALELVGDGHLFIDEVTDLSLNLQAQLLRVLENKTYSPLGGTPKKCDARLIFSTSRDLTAAVAEGELLDGLRQRLSVFMIEMKPLAERRSDILPLAEHILYRLRGERAIGFSEEAEAWLAAQAWRGNLRELQASIEKALLVSKGNIVEVGDLQLSRISDKPSIKSDVEIELGQAIRDWTRTQLLRLDQQGTRVLASQSDTFGTLHEDFLSAVESPFLQAMLEAYDRNRAAVAAQLGLHRSTLRQKMRKYKIDTPS